jgi:hypothetical protein
MSQITFRPTWRFEVFSDAPCVGYFPPAAVFEPTLPAWASYVIYPEPPPVGYSRIVEENERYFASLGLRLIVTETSARTTAGPLS